MGADGTQGNGTLGQGKTNPRPRSTVNVKLAPEPLVFYRPETNELLVIPAEKSTAFLNEVRLLDRLMYESVTAKEACLRAGQELLVAQRASTGPDRNVPQDSQVVHQAQAKMDAANKALEEKQKKLEDEFKPLGKLDDTGGKLYELVPISKRGTPNAGARTPAQREGHTWAKKWTYVRSDKVKSHFRSYQLNKEEQAKHQGNGEKSVIDAQGKIDTTKLREQINKLETSAKWKKEVEAHGVFLKDLNTSIHRSLDEWANGLNGGPLNVKLEPEFQLLRYFAGAGVEANWDPKKGNMAVRANASAEFAIAEGKFTASCYWPGQAGLMLEMTGPKTGKLYKAGLVRGALELELFGIAGASASAQLGVTVDYTDLTKGKVGMRGRPNAKAMSNKAVDIGKKVRDGADVDGAVDLFAGARASGSVKGKLEWNNPEAKQFTSLCEIGPGGQLQAGAGVSATFQITFAEGKFRFLCAASVCLGVGAGGKLEFEVDAGKTLEFSKYVAYMLYAVGYEFTGMFIDDAYKLLTNLGVWAVKEGKELVDAVNHCASDVLLETTRLVFEISEKLRRDFEKESERIALMNRVLAHSKVLEYATPEAKGIILYQLTRHDFHSVAGAASIPANTDAGDYLPWRPEFVGRRKRAIVIVCKKIRSKAEFRNVMQHMTADGSADLRGWQANFEQVKAFLNLGSDSEDLDKQVDDYMGGLAMLDSGSGLQSLYNQLYDAPVLGYPFVDNTEKVYMARVDMGDHAGYAVSGGYNPGPEKPDFLDCGDDTMRYV